MEKIRPIDADKLNEAIEHGIDAKTAIKKAQTLCVVAVAPRFQNGKKISEARQNGISCKTIGEGLGLTKQNIWDIVKRMEKFSAKQQAILDSIIYLGIKYWIVENGMTVKKACDFLAGGDKQISNTYRRFLTGQYRGNVELIKHILDVTNMTFEEAFQEEER